MNEELHLLDPRPIFMRHLRDWIDAFLVVCVLILVLGYVQMQDEIANLRDELTRQQVVICPSNLGGKSFIFSAYEAVNLLRPGYATLSCFYKSGVSS